MDTYIIFLPSFAINGCSATQLAGMITWSVLAWNLVPSPIILTVSKHWHAHVLNYHFASLGWEISAVFRIFAFSRKSLAKLRKWRLIRTAVSGFFIFLHCIMGESDANCRPYWKRSTLAKTSQIFWFEISRPGCFLLNAYHLAFQDVYLPPLLILHIHWKVLPLL